MKVSQQIVGVNQRLGNTAVSGMQGTTRYIFDSQLRAAAADQTLTFFSGVSSRAWPLSNLSQNKFEVGESLAIQGITYFYRAAAVANYNSLLTAQASIAAADTYTLIFNFYIGNQRVIKDMELWSYSRFNIGESANTATTDQSVVRLETPIVIPPQIEFYATIRETGPAATEQRLYCGLFGTGTLLNTKSNF